MTIDVYKWTPDLTPITFNGIFEGMPIDVYHSNNCDGPSVSSTGLRQIVNNPALYWANSYLNPDKEPEEDKEAYKLGSASHTLTLGDTKFFNDFAVKPATYFDPKTGEEKKWTGNAKYCKDWAAENDAKTLLSDKQFEQLKGIAGVLPWQKACQNSGLQQSGLVQGGVLSGMIERSMIVKDPETGIYLKARPDNDLMDFTNPVDLKTCDDISKVRRKIEELGYNVQAGVIAECVKLLTGQDVEEFLFVFVETKAPFRVRNIFLDADQLNEARRFVRGGLRRLADCLDKGEFPAGEDEPCKWQPSTYYQEHVAYLEREGIIPATL